MLILYLNVNDDCFLLYSELQPYGFWLAVFGLNNPKIRCDALVM